jgi:uracil-DNA glycosylase family protein
MRFLKCKMPAKSEEYARPARPPDSSSFSTIRKAANRCTACHLYKNATQTVFGEGPKIARIMFVGEQPGDYEDVAGKPFVGPAGKIMDRALEEAGIDRKEVYVTNAVKHFKWEPRGKRRLHKKPNAREIAACRPWLESELRLVKPNLLVVRAPQRPRRFSALHSASHANAAKCSLQNSGPRFSQLSTHHQCSDSRMKNPVIVNINALSQIFGSP